MVDFEYKSSYDVYDFKELIRLLRGEGGCPWDREQTHQSIRRNFLEEAYEVCEAIDEGDCEHLREELGDVLMQVLFHARIEEEVGRFDIDSVADKAVKKLISRHPHVFGDATVSDAADVLDKWEGIKRLERAQETVNSSMDSVAESLPSLWRAEKIQKKAAKVGFDWPEIDGALDKAEEELSELRQAVKTGDGVEEELGDLLFAAVNVARFAGVDPEDALHAACGKFIARFRFMEEEADRRGLDLEHMSLDEMEALYQLGKNKPE